MPRSACSSVYVLLLAATLCPAAAETAGFPVFGVSSQRFPFTSLAAPQTAAEEELEVRLRTATVQAGYGLAYSRGHVLLNVVEYRRLSAAYAGVPTDSIFSPDHVHALTYTCRFVWQRSRERSWMFFVSPGLISDLDGALVRRDWGVQGGFLYSIQSGNRIVGLGAAWSEDLGQSLPLPFLQLQWSSPDGPWQVQALLPSQILVARRCGPRLDLALHLQLDGNQYHLGEFAPAIDWLRYSTGTMGPAAVIHLTPFLHLTVDTGVTFLRRFELFDGDDEIRSLDLEHAAFLRAGLSVGPQ